MPACTPLTDRNPATTQRATQNRVGTQLQSPYMLTQVRGLRKPDLHLLPTQLLAARPSLTECEHPNVMAACTQNAKNGQTVGDKMFVSRTANQRPSLFFNCRQPFVLLKKGSTSHHSLANQPKKNQQIRQSRPNGDPKVKS